MLRLFIVVIFASFAYPLVVLPTAARAAAEDGCGDWCNFEAVKGKPRAAQECAVNIHLIQRVPQHVKLRFYDGEGGMLERSKQNQDRHENYKRAQDFFCVGAHYLRNAIASGGWAELVNEEGICSRLDAELLAQILEAGRTREGNPACLLGDTERCELLGFSAGF